MAETPRSAKDVSSCSWWDCGRRCLLDGRACVAWLLRAKVAPHANPAQLAGGWRPGPGARHYGAGDGDGTRRSGCAGGHAAARVAAIGSAAPRPASPAALAGLSPQQLAGQRVIYSYPGLTPPASLISLIQHGEAAGVIFFGQNISGKAQIAGVIKRLDQADASPLNPVQAPLLLMTDQEGGRSAACRAVPTCRRSRSAPIRYRRRKPWPPKRARAPRPTCAEWA